jgi:hypothetical protein
MRLIKTPITVNRAHEKGFGPKTLSRGRTSRRSLRIPVSAVRSATVAQSASPREAGHNRVGECGRYRGDGGILHGWIDTVFTQKKNMRVFDGEGTALAIASPLAQGWTAVALVRVPAQRVRRSALPAVFWAKDEGGKFAEPLIVEKTWRRLAIRVEFGGLVQMQ